MNSDDFLTHNEFESDIDVQKEMVYDYDDSNFSPNSDSQGQFRNPEET